MKCSVRVYFAALATVLFAGCSSNKTQSAAVPAEASLPSSVVLTPPSMCVDFSAFTENYRISHFLESAVELQSLGDVQREARLRQIAKLSPNCGEAIVLCRMLLEDRSGAELRSPRLGAPNFVGSSVEVSNLVDKRLSKRWEQEPISIVGGVPILIVRGYTLEGLPELPERYIDYCLANGRWRKIKYATVPRAKLEEIVHKFMAEHPCDQYDAEWLRSQAE
ncbi:MAG: hypothetical protein WC718_02700 [Phycisphaerales bacterium]|jgi:hypothetical protein